MLEFRILSPALDVDYKLFHLKGAADEDPDTEADQ